MKKQVFYTIPMLAKELGVSRIAVYKRVKNGRIKAIRAGTSYLIPFSEAQKHLSGNDKRIIKKAVDRVFKEYGDVIQKLGNE